MISMDQANECKRIVAIDLRSSRFGFAVFEGPERLLDWGVKSFRQGVNAVRIPTNVKLAELMDEFSPKTIVLLQRDIDTKKRASMREQLQREAEKRRIAIRLLSPRVVKSAFVGSNRNKHTIAAAVIERLPELASRRPAARKFWRPEDYRLRIFDAASLGLAYFSHYRNRNQQSQVPPRGA
jgi:hypothetical protein